jgi:hypothetical protein
VAEEEEGMKFRQLFPERLNDGLAWVLMALVLCTWPAILLAFGLVKLGRMVFK